MFANQNRKNAASAKPNGAASSLSTYESRMRSRRGGRGGAARANVGVRTPGYVVIRLADAGDDAVDVRARLRIRRGGVLSIHRTGVAVVRGDREPNVSFVAPQQVAQVARAAVHVRIRVERVGDAVHRGGSGHQLHQSLGADARDGAGITVR